MEAVTAILGGGVRVGVVLKGKKVRDDSRTLQQAGISQSGDLDTLGFTLEPSFTNICSTKTTKKHTTILQCDADQELLKYDNFFSFSPFYLCFLSSFGGDGIPSLNLFSSLFLS